MDNLQQVNHSFKKYSLFGFDCDGRKIHEFRILRAPFSANIEDWEVEPNVDPRFYCLVRSSNGEILAVSVYDDWNSQLIRNYENLTEEDDIPMLIKSVSEMMNYEVAFCGITGGEWYYERDKEALRSRLNVILQEENKLIRKRSK